MKPFASRKPFFQLALVLFLMIVLIPRFNGVVKAQSIPMIPGSNGVYEPSLRQGDEPIVIYFFWGDGCPHCAEAKPFLANLVQENPRVKIQAFEVWNDKENAELLKQFAAGFGFEVKYVPTIFIGEKYWQGFSDSIQLEIQATVEQYLISDYTDRGAQFLNGVVGTSLPTPEATVESKPVDKPTPMPAVENGVLLPLFGSVEFSKQSLLVSTLLISFVDGFNPCSIWVLSMLLAISLHTGSRKKVLIIGLVFLTVTAAIYALFIAGLFTVFTVASFGGWLQIVVALVAMFFALVNIKDYFWYKEGLSFTIDDKNKPGIYQKIRKVMDAGDSFLGPGQRNNRPCRRGIAHRVLLHSRIPGFMDKPADRSKCNGVNLCAAPVGLYVDLPNR